MARTYEHKFASKPGKTVKLDLDAIDKKSAENLKKTPDGGEIIHMAARSLVLIGLGHSKDAVDVAEDAHAYKGKIKITKGNWTGADPGTLEVTGMVANRSEFETTLKRYTKKKIIYK